jgi:hypothetical protein
MSQDGKCQLLREALVGLVGADGDELDQMEVGIRMMNVPENEKTSILNAIHALRDTLELVR